LIVPTITPISDGDTKPTNVYGVPIAKKNMSPHITTAACRTSPALTQPYTTVASKKLVWYYLGLLVGDGHAFRAAPHLAGPWSCQGGRTRRRISSDGRVNLPRMTSASTAKRQQQVVRPAGAARLESIDFNPNASDVLTPVVIMHGLLGNSANFRGWGTKLVQASKALMLHRGLCVRKAENGREYCTWEQSPGEWLVF